MLDVSVDEVVGEPDGDRGAGDDRPRDDRHLGRVANRAVRQRDDLSGD